MKIYLAIASVFCLAMLGGTKQGMADSELIRIAIVSSYDKEYLWSQETNKGLTTALLQFGYLDNEVQAEEFTLNDYVVSSRVVIKKLWMNSKHKHSKEEIANNSARIIKEVDGFRPHIIMLGDDNATNYIGNHYIDSEVPVVFWGVNGNPLKYGLVDSIEKPGHNVTGIYQAGYLKDGVIWLRKLLPNINSMAVLSDDSPTGRTKAKELARLERLGQLPVDLVEIVITNSLESWRAKALELRNSVDAFFVLNHNTLEDKDGNSIDQLALGAWYLRNIRKPDISHERQFVVEGILCAVDDSGFKQGFEAANVVHRILDKGENPALIPVYAPERGAFIVNIARAKMLGLAHLVVGNPLVEEWIETALALETFPELPGNSEY